MSPKKRHPNLLTDFIMSSSKVKKYNKLKYEGGTDNGDFVNWEQFFKRFISPYQDNYKDL